MNLLHLFFLQSMAVILFLLFEQQHAPSAGNRHSRYTPVKRQPFCKPGQPLAAFVNRYDIIITEIMADPSPSAGLPEFEFVELKNNSSHPIDLKGFKLEDETGSASFSTSIVLKPDSFLVVCSGNAATLLKTFGPVAALSNYPSLGNETDLVQLVSPAGQVVHAIRYQSGWHNNPLKAGGGWSLEMINTNTPCAGSSNWSSSTASIGGTPGRPNSLQHKEADQQPPALLNTYNTDSTHLIAVFDEPLDSNSAAQPKNFRLSPFAGNPLTTAAIPPLFNTAGIRLSAPMKKSTVYELVVTGLRDCAGNSIGQANKVKAGLPESPAANDLVINELLFDPPPDGCDYVELFNRSEKTFALQQLQLSNRNSNNELANSKALSSTPLQLFPGEFAVFCESPDWVGHHFAVKDRSRLFKSDLPSLPNDKGKLVLTDGAGAVIDEMNYEVGWHYPLLTDPEGIALERIDPQQPASLKSNWTSAAGSRFAGTPGYLNSQYRSMGFLQGRFQLSRTVFSPDNDGIDDLIFLEYKMEVPGTVATVTLLDLSGRQVRQLSKNSLLAHSGFFSWNGLNDNAQPCAEGIYILQLSWFSNTGQTGRWKQALGLVRKKK